MDSLLVDPEDSSASEEMRIRASKDHGLHEERGKESGERAGVWVTG